MAYSMNIKTSQKIIDQLQPIPSLTCQDNQDTESDRTRPCLVAESTELQQAKITARAFDQTITYLAYSITLSSNIK
jgi:hypothetical protein